MGFRTSSASVGGLIEMTMRDRLDLRVSGVRLAFALLIVSVSVAAVAADVTPEPLRRAKANFDLVRDYSADALLTVDGPRVHIKNMKYKIYFKQPDKLKVEAKEGFALIPKENMVFGDPVRELTANYRINDAGKAQLNGRATRVLKATPKISDIATPPMTLWVDEQRGLIVQSETKSAIGETGRVRIDYSMIDKKYWMPSRVTIQSAEKGRPPAREGRSGRGARSIDTAGKLTLELRNYRINKGISEDVFRQALPAR